MSAPKKPKVCKLRGCTKLVAPDRDYCSRQHYRQSPKIRKYTEPFELNGDGQ